jgi:hypothetical protein
MLIFYGKITLMTFTNNSNNINRILYCHVPKSTDRVSQGHWFYLEGQGIQCAQVAQTNEGWNLYIDAEIYGKPLPDLLQFKTIDECKKFVSGYFDEPILDIRPKDFPEPDV